jgi:hypothetical protein
MAAAIAIANGVVHVVMPGGDQFWALHGPLQIPLANITNAYVSTRRELHLRWRLLGTGAGSLMTAGRFSDERGAQVFCDLSGSPDSDVLVIETRNYEFKKIALTMANGVSANDAAHAICASLTKRGA